MKFHTSSQSFCAAPVQLLLSCFNEPDVEIVEYDLTPGLWTTRSSAAFGKLNANKRVPVLEDGELVVTESTACLRFLAAKLGGGETSSEWYGQSAEERARVDSVLDWEHAHVQPAIRQLIDTLCLFSDSETRDERCLAQLDVLLFGSDDLMFVGLPHGVHHYLAIAQKQWLGKSDFLAGAALSIADLPLFVDLFVLETVLKQDLAAFDALAAWRGRVEAALKRAMGERWSGVVEPFMEALGELAELLDCPRRHNTQPSGGANDDDDDDDDDNAIANDRDDDDDNDDDDDEEAGISRWAAKRIVSEYGRLVTRDEMWAAEEQLSLEQRRDRYHRGNFVGADALSPWAEYGRSIYYADEEREAAASDAVNRKVALFHGDITMLELDAIVNAANSSLLGGGGIDGAIHRAAGDKLYCECVYLDGAETGQCKITRGYDLPARHVLHCVGPIGEKPPLLRACYTNALELVTANKLRTVAFCGISTGIYGYPLQNAAHVALATIREWLDVPANRDSVDRIVLVTFLQKEKDVYETLMAKYFPLEWTDAEIEAEKKRATAENSEDDDGDNNEEDCAEEATQKIVDESAANVQTDGDDNDNDDDIDDAIVSEPAV